MFLLNSILSVFIVVLVEIKLVSTAVEGNRGTENGEIHLLMGFGWSSFILE